MSGGKFDIFCDGCGRKGATAGTPHDARKQLVGWSRGGTRYYRGQVFDEDFCPRCLSERRKVIQEEAR
jgi:hypothetical protein